MLVLFELVRISPWTDFKKKIGDFLHHVPTEWQRKSAFWIPLQLLSRVYAVYL